jgi:hypothetical protein
MSEKQVIMSKIEFDNMEKELDNLRKIVKDKTISIIRTPHYGWSNYSTCVDGYIQQYVFGVDENKVVEDLSNEIKNLKKDNEDYKQRVFSLDNEMWRLKEESNAWKKLPWYKRLFVK